MTRIFINKAKYNGTIVEIEFTEHREHGTDTISMSSDDLPAPSFVKAQEELMDVFSELMKAAGVDVNRDGLKVNGATFSENEKQGFGGTIQAVKADTSVKGVIVLNLPHYTVGTGSGTGPGQLTQTQAKVLRKYQLEALDYLDGKRGQQTLFDGKMAAANDSTTAATFPVEERERTEEELAFALATKVVAEKPKKAKAEKPGKVRVTKRKGVKGVDDGDGDGDE